MGTNSRYEAEVLKEFRFWLSGSLWVIFCLMLTVIFLFLSSGYASAAPTVRVPITMPTNANLFSSGFGTVASDVLTIESPGVEFIPNASSASRVAATMSEGVAIAESGVVSALKTGLKANAASLAVTATVAGLLAGVDWIYQNSQLQKQGLPAALPVSHVDPASGTYFYANGWDGGQYLSTGQGSCDSGAAAWNALVGAGSSVSSDSFAVDNVSTGSGVCTWTSTVAPAGNHVTSTFPVQRYGSTCAPASSYDSTTGTCVSTVPVGLVPVTDADMSVLDGFVRGKDGTWQRDLINDMCTGTTNFDQCVAVMGGKPYLTGPATVTATPTQTQTQTKNADGTVTTVTTTTSTDYAVVYGTDPSPYADISPTVTTTTGTQTTSPTGTIVSTGTTTTTQTTPSPGASVPADQGSFTDTPFPAVTPFYTQKFPDGFQGVWDKNKAGFDSSSFVTFMHSFVPSFSGSCPTWSMSFDIWSNAHFGSQSFGDLCYIFAIVKTIMLVTAMFTCRALIFGG